MTTEQRFLQILREQLGVDEVTRESTFEQLNADSLDQVELTMACEVEFNLEIPDELVPDTYDTTVGQALSRLEALIARAGV